MKPTFRITRRRVLQFFAGMLGAASVPVSLRSATGTSAASDPAIARAIDALISNKVSAAVIGAAYLRQFEQERSIEILQVKIHDSVSDEDLPIDEHTLLRRIATDFEHGYIVNLQGWLLSRTEARLCALCATHK